MGRSGVGTVAVKGVVQTAISEGETARGLSHTLWGSVWEAGRVVTGGAGRQSMAHTASAFALLATTAAAGS